MTTRLKAIQIKWNKKPTKYTIFLVLFFFFLVSLFVIDWGNIFSKNTYTEHTTGIILNIKERNIPVQTKIGTQIQTVQYLIECAYEINNLKYAETIYVPYNAAINKFLLEIGYPENNIVEIFYNKNNPKQYRINTNYKSNFYKK